MQRLAGLPKLGRDFHWTLTCLVWLLLWPLWPAATHGNDGGGPKVSEVTVGIQGQYQVGRWTAISGTVKSDTWPVTVSVRVPDPDGNLVRFPLGEISQSSSSSARFSGLFKAGRLDGVIRIDLQTEEETWTITRQAGNRQEEGQDSTLQVWTQQTQLWAILGDAAAFPAAVDRIIQQSSGSRLPVKLIELTHAAELPTQPEALQALDVLVINGPQDIPPDVNEAFRSWVINGGHLVVSMSRAEDYVKSPMEQWLPLRVIGESRLRNLSFLTVQVPGSAPIRLSEVEALRFEMDYGESIAATPDGPVWARMPVGFGRVSVLGISLSRPPLANWESLPLLCEQLADSPAATVQSQQRTAAAQLSQTGISDLQTQLANGLDLFPAIHQSTTWMVMGAMALFLIVIGPLDYLIVHKLLKRPHWTWVTFPILVLVAAGAAIGAARQRASAEPLANQVDLVDLDAASGRTRVRSLISFTSPQSARYHVTAGLAGSGGEIVGAARKPLRLCWTGIPETGFRGMYRTGGLDLAKSSYAIAPQLDALLDLPVTERSSVNVSATWTGSQPSPNGIVTADLREEAGELRGTVTNNLTFPLHDWFLAWEGRVYTPETQRGGATALKIQPSETIDMNNYRRVVAQTLKHYFVGLRNYRVQRGKNKVSSDVEAARDVYDPLSRDPYTILRMVSFFRACDGDEFTSLTNRSLDNYDLSTLLPLDRAVLFCRMEELAITHSLDEQPLTTTEQMTILRIVLPVETP